MPISTPGFRVMTTHCAISHERYVTELLCPHYNKLGSLAFTIQLHKLCVASNFRLSIPMLSHSFDFLQVVRQLESLVKLCAWLHDVQV